MSLMDCYATAMKKNLNASVMTTNTMKATIDIKTPAGKSLEGFPKEFDDLDESTSAADYLFSWSDELSSHGTNPLLHPGDTITITINKD